MAGAADACLGRGDRKDPDACIEADVLQVEVAASRNDGVTFSEKIEKE